MQNIQIQLLLIAILPLSFISQLVSPTPEIEKPLYWENPAPIEVIQKYSAEYGVDANLVYSVLKCESGLQHPKIGDGGKSVSIAQWNPETFKDEAKKKGEVLDINSMHDATKLAIWTMSEGRGYKWTMYQAVVKGGSYTFKNSYTGETQTVYCKYQSIPI